MTPEGDASPWLFDHVDPGAPIKVLDVGAARFDSTREPYLDAARRGHAQVCAFEPRNETGATPAPAQAWAFISCALGAGGNAELRHCASPGMSSLREPSAEIGRIFHGFKDELQVEARSTIDTQKLDHRPEARGADLMKLDVQGWEREVLEGACASMASLLAIECEVQIVEQYEGQALFPELATILHRRGFMLHSILGFGSRLPRSIAAPTPHAPGSQWIWADALFVRKLSDWPDLDDAALVRLAVILSDMYAAVDMAAHALSLHSRREEMLERAQACFKRRLQEPDPA
jgi:FkbM family methyltransferase